MNYHNITKDDMRNGEGLRVVLWVAGCAHRCRECQNPITWDPDGGLPFTDREREEIFRELEKDYVSGITFSGGDPLYPSNVPEVTELARTISGQDHLAVYRLSLGGDFRYGDHPVSGRGGGWRICAEV